MFIIPTHSAKAQTSCERLVWQDEFDGSTLDQTKWGYETGDGCPDLCQWGTGQLDYSTDRQENVRVENGKLVLELRKENYGGREYTSGRIRTYKKANFRYGRIEARVKGVYSNGLGFAFWMLGSSFEKVSWPKCGEIDIFEQTGKYPNYNIGTAHYQDSWGHAWNQGKYWTPDSSRFADAFHTVGLQWTPDSMSWYIDGKIYHTFHISKPINGYDPFNRDFFIILSVGMGGDYSGLPNAQTVTPQQVQVDYVRVYQGALNTSVNGDIKVYEGDTNKEYYTEDVPGATYNWSVPVGSTIASGQGTSKIKVNFGPTSGKVILNETTSGCGSNTYSKEVLVQKPIIVDKIYDDFENNRHCTYDYRAGTLTDAVANPLSSTINSSAKVAKYVRNPVEAWDAIVMLNVDPGHAGEFVQGKKRLFIDVYTDAPIGTKVSLGFENSKVAVPTASYGKHSNYAAYTTKQNTWERLEFVLTDIPDKYAGSFKVDKFVLMFDPGNKSSNTYYFDNLRSGQSGPDAPILSKTILENFDGTSNLAISSVTGGYVKVANPSASGINTSPNVVKYTRSAATAYDNLSYKIQLDDASLFRDGTNTVSFDVYTSAPVGKIISIHFEDSTIVAGANWEAPIHSIYEGRVEKQNAWQTITFKWSSTPNGSVPNVNVNKMVVLIDENSTSGDVYYIDNIQINSSQVPVNPILNKVVENFEDIRNLELVWTGEDYTAAFANPYPTGVNTSAKVAKYIRHAVNANDWLVYNLKTDCDAKSLREKTKVFAMDVYTNAPVGKVITIGLEAGSLATSANWPTGRHSEFATATKAQNQWHTVKFIYSNSADPSTPDNLVNKLTFTFNQGLPGDYTYYFDNVRILEIVKDTVLSSIAVTPALTQNVALNQTIQFTAAGKDQFGKAFTTKPVWNVSGGGTITTAGLFKATANGVYKVNAVDGTVMGSADVLIGESIKLSKIMLSPATATFNQGASVQLTAAGYDQLSRPFTISNLVYAISPAGATITNGLFASNTPGVYTVTASSAGVSTSSVITVRATPVLTTLTLSPLETKIVLSGSQQFSATTKDQYGDNIASTLTWSCSGATISSTGIFTANALGTYVVKVQSGTKQASTYISVVETPTNIALRKPATASSEENYGTVVAYVNDGDVATRWGSNATDAQWVKVNLQNSYNLSSIVLNWEAACGKSYDIKVSDNDVNYTTIVSETNGSAGKRTYNVNASARYILVQGITRATTYGYSLYELEAYGVLAVTPAIKSVVVTPNYTEVNQNATQQFTGKAFDQFGNIMSLPLAWSANGGTINSSALYTASAVGTFNITASNNGVSGAAQIKVNGNTPPTVSISSPAANASFVSGTDVVVSANAADADGTIAKVELFVDGVLKAVKTTSPYSVTVTGLAVGTHSVYAVATDNNGSATTSATVSITVTSGTVDTNIALNKPATTSSYEGDMTATKANDGALNTRWGSAFADPQWMAIDLQGSFNISKVVLTWEAASGKVYNIETSNDNVAWSSVKTVTNGVGGTETYTLSGVTAKYIRIYGTHRNTGYGYSLWEFEVYGTPSAIGNVVVTGVALTPTTASIAVGATVQLTAAVAPVNATNKTVSFASSNNAVATVSTTGLVTGVSAGSATITATTQDGNKVATSAITVVASGGNLALNKPAVATTTQAGLALANINDGNTTTRWSSDWTDVQAVTIDLQASYTISKVVLNWEGACGKNYTVDVSADNVTWTTIYTTTTGNGGIVTISPTTTATGRYIRMNGTVRATGWGYSIWEFEVYGTAALKDVQANETIADAEVKTAQQVKFYPNPVVDKLNLEIGEASGLVSLVMYDIAGNVTLEQAIDSNNSSIELDMSLLPVGTYVIKLIGENRAEVVKVIKR